MDEEDLQNPDSWDFDAAELHQPAKRPRAVVSVAFQRDEYDRMVDLAQRYGMRTSEYIREAALGRITVRQATGTISSVGGVRSGNFTGPAMAPISTVDRRSGVVAAKRAEGA